MRDALLTRPWGDVGSESGDDEVGVCGGPMERPVLWPVPPLGRLLTSSIYFVGGAYRPLLCA